ncbi:hypothetical protein BC832DRAFT_592116 [Gaertneriomyces semiglobifer]|nr:hypothetical protein BC832DRAFT_592116 [Gaertneriomyces semiglobifer]
MSDHLETIRQNYRSSLADLTFNSKPIINSLTMFADVNKTAAGVIVKVIEDQLRNAQPKQKLPVFYLVDSILKNVGEPYTALFEQVIYQAFTSAYVAVPPPDKDRFARVLGTWNHNPTGPIFNAQIRSALDGFIQKQKSADARRLSLGSIHVNPNFVGVSKASNIPFSNSALILCVNLQQNGPVSPNVHINPNKRPVPYDHPAIHRQQANIARHDPRHTRRSPSIPEPRSQDVELRTGMTLIMPLLMWKPHSALDVSVLWLEKRLQHSLVMKRMDFCHKPRLYGYILLDLATHPSSALRHEDTAPQVHQLQHQIQALLTQRQSQMSNPVLGTSSNDAAAAVQVQILTQLLQSLQSPASYNTSSLNQISQVVGQLQSAIPSAAIAPASLAGPNVLPGHGVSSALSSGGVTGTYISPALMATAFPSIASQPLGPAGGVNAFNIGTNYPMPVDAGGVGVGTLGVGISAVNPWSSTPFASSMAYGNIGAGMTGVQTDSGNINMNIGNNMGMGGHLGGGGHQMPREITSMSDLPRIRLCTEDVNNKSVPFASRASLIYTALSLQCRQCGHRFERTPVGHQKMDAHLDWHFRQNRRQKEKHRKAISREWYISEDDWVGEGEVDVNTAKVGAGVLFGDGEEKNGKEPVVEEVMNTPAGSEMNPKCSVCLEALERFYDEEREEWMLRGCLREGGKLYHQTCFDDLPPAVKNAKSKDEKRDSPAPIVSTPTMPTSTPHQASTPSPVMKNDSPSGKRKRDAAENEGGRGSGNSESKKFVKLEEERVGAVVF